MYTHHTLPLTICPHWLSSAGRAVLSCILALGFVRSVDAQEIGFVFASNDDQKIQAFAARGVPVDLMSTGITYVRLEPEGRSIELFRETAAPVLVRTYDSLQTDTELGRHP